MAEVDRKPTYEPGEVGRPWFIALSVGAAILVAAICMVALYFYYLPFAPEKPIALSEFPAPRLQVDPPADLAKLEREQKARLNETRWLDREVGTLAIPIDAAMAAIVQRGSEAFAPLPALAPAAEGAGRPTAAHPPADRPSNPGSGDPDPMEAPR